MKLHFVWLVAAINLLVGSANLNRAHAASSRPNILFAFADDWGRHASCYAKLDGDHGIGDLVQTPNFDRLARRGVLFRSAFVNAPSCTPCRSSLLSGQYFWRTGRGAILRGAKWDDQIPSWPLLLRDGGYHIGKTYKVWSPGTPADAPFGRQKYAYQKAGGRFNRFSQTASRMVASGKSFDEAKTALLGDVHRNFADFLAARQENQPFCYWFGATNVHRSYQAGSGKSLWGIDPDKLKGKLPPFFPDAPEIRQDVADYLGEIQAFDAALGVLLDELDKAGLTENTLIVVGGDHGAPGFPNGKCNLYDFGLQVPLAIAGPGVEGERVVDDLVSLPDLAPTFLDSGKVKTPDVMTARSLWPVLRSKKQGLVDPARTWVVAGRERHVEMARAGNLPYPQRSIRTADHLFIVNFHPERNPLGDPLDLDGDNPPSTEELLENYFTAYPDFDVGPTKAWMIAHRNDPEWKPYFDRAFGKRPREELYDLKKDPHQMHNVAADEANAAVADQLREQLMAELKRSGDPRLVDDGRYFETPPLGGFPWPDDVPKPNRPNRRRR